ncbi:vegetative incompatibility protein HET-E-1-like isoform X2 [Abrus precatorius]|uniref:Vegetative incompatibility protein HET-E-1-like isoform X2 n=1 Tax=Abrus precatorius TaxID=3816 RepID=A0A8B8JTJ2_ABRPR|nr:vegetative incompatibility protein HET-E-1-like isoform X2 [Abrus precatorius]
MLISDEGDNDVFFDSLDCLSPTQESFLTEQEFGYEIWVNEPLSVKERRERFLLGMGLACASCSDVRSQEKMMSCDASSVSLGLERIRDCSGAISNDCTTSEAQVLFDESKGCFDDKPEGKVYEVSCTDQELRHGSAEALEEFQHFDMGKKEKKSWWKHFINNRKGDGRKIRSKFNSGKNKTCRVNVRLNKKSWMEFSALYIGQEIRAHKGLIWTMKFSPNGHYLASGGEDGVIRIWRVTSLSTSSISFTAEDSAVSRAKHDISCSRKKPSSQSFIALPNKISNIEESPLQEFYGHSSDVLDLAWSNSDTLLSSSMDKTVRLWKIGCNQCLRVFHHKDYVTCIQFNPIDENYFISGSIDGKVRIWGIHEERVVDWAYVRDVISAIRYQPDGKGFVVGSLTGTCRFYVASGKHFQLEAQIRVNGKKRTSGNKITGIQFSQNNHRRVMITSEDSKVRILEGNELVQTFKGLPKSGSQMSGSFTSCGKHIISVGEDSRVYIWNFNDLGSASSKQTKSKYSCEYFCSEGVTVAMPWSGMSAEQRSSGNDFAHCSSEMQHQLEGAHGLRESERFSFGSWFSIDGTCRGSMTWPEEKLPSWDLPLAEVEFDHHQLCNKDPCHDKCVSETWGLSIVTAGCDGTIKTFHNFGLPIRL